MRVVRLKYTNTQHLFLSTEVGPIGLARTHTGNTSAPWASPLPVIQIAHRGMLLSAWSEPRASIAAAFVAARASTAMAGKTAGFAAIRARSAFARSVALSVAFKVVAA